MAIVGVLVANLMHTIEELQEDGRSFMWQERVAQSLLELVAK